MPEVKLRAQQAGKIFLNTFNRTEGKKFSSI